MTFQREKRYIVLKHKDVAWLSIDDAITLRRICSRIDIIRAERGAGEIECVVVEHDWPEHEYVWGLIQHRMEVFGK